MNVSKVLPGVRASRYKTATGDENKLCNSLVQMKLKLYSIICIAIVCSFPNITVLDREIIVSLLVSYVTACLRSEIFVIGVNFYC